MQLIQKMILTLLSIALIPVFLVSLLFYLHTSSSLRERELSRLEAIASIQQSRIEHLTAQNQALMTNYTARTALRANLDRYNQFGRAADRDLLQQSVTTLQVGDATMRTVSILNASGKVVASTDAASVGRDEAGADYFARGREGVDVTSTISRNRDGSMSLYLTGPFILGNRLIGVAVIESDMSEFLDLARSYTGLGATGETLVVRREANGSGIYVLPLRFDKTAAMRRNVAGMSDQDPVMRVLAKEAGTFTDGTDYRGQRVLAASRYIAAADWGLVVKVDEAEAYTPLSQLTDLLLVVIFILSVLIIFVAFYLARRLNEPILNLVMTADRVRGGDLTARATVSTRDETGQLAETFNAMADNIEKVDQMKSEFVLLTSHQLRTPATAVKGFMSMLLDGYAGKMQPKQRKLVETAYTENERQISVINSILDVARLEAGEMVLERRTQNVGEILEASAKGQASLLEGHKQSIAVLLPKRPVELWIDGDKLQLVIDNLIHNAIKYSPAGTKITVELKKHRDHVLIEVSDHGIGIGRQDQHRLFKRFSRIAGPHTANIQGAGLGLYLAEKLIAMHGGQIDVHSREGVGTRFSITLPNITKET
jgi:signal transduction histidine kinase